MTADSIPAFYRGGCIVPRRERARRSTATQVRRTGQGFQGFWGSKAAQCTWGVAAARLHGLWMQQRSHRVGPRGVAQVHDPLTLVVALDHQQQASGDLYLDDGRSFAFMRGQYVHR